MTSPCKLGMRAMHSKLREHGHKPHEPAVVIGLAGAADPATVAKRLLEKLPRLAEMRPTVMP